MRQVPFRCVGGDWLEKQRPFFFDNSDKFCEPNSIFFVFLQELLTRSLEQ